MLKDFRRNEQHHPTHVWNYVLSHYQQKLHQKLCPFHVTDKKNCTDTMSIWGLSQSHITFPKSRYRQNCWVNSIQWLRSMFSSHLPLEVAAGVAVDHTPIAVISTEGQGTSPISVPVSASIPTAPRQLDSLGSPRMETPLTVSTRNPLTTVVANCYSFSQLRTPKCLSSQALTMYRCQTQQLLWPTLSVQQYKRQYSC